MTWFQSLQLSVWAQGYLECDKEYCDECKQWCADDIIARLHALIAAFFCVVCKKCVGRWRMPAAAAVLCPRLGIKLLSYKKKYAHKFIAMTLRGM